MPMSVAELCRQQKLDLDTLTSKSGLERERVISIFEGRWTPTPEERKQVAGALGVEVKDIAWGHKTPIQHLYGHGPG